MSTASRAPALIDALVACFLTVLDADSVRDGPSLVAPSGQQFVYVGVDDPENADSWLTAADGGQGWEWLGHSQRRETVNVPCVLVAWNGDGDQKAARDALYTTMTTLTTAVETDPSLGGAALYTVGVTSFTLQQRQEDGGADARLLFTVQFETLT